MEHARHLCYRCGSVELSPGSVVGMDIGLKPDDCRFWVAGTSRVSIRGNMCRECDVLHLDGDLEKLERLDPSETS